MIVCNCKMIDSKEIDKFAKKYPLSTFQELIVSTGVSTGCGRCRDLAEQQFEIAKGMKLKECTQLSINFER